MKVKKKKAKLPKSERLTFQNKIATILIKYLLKLYKDMQLKIMPEDCANISNIYNITLKN